MKSKWIWGAGFLAIFGTVFWFANDKGQDSKSVTKKVAPSRTTSSVKPSSSSTEMEQVRKIEKAIYGITSKYEVNDKIAEIQKISKANPEWQIVKLFALLTKPLTSLEGIIWRIRPVIEECGACHVAALSAIKGLYYSDYLVGPHLKAGLDYVAEPTSKYGQFQKVSDIQEFLFTDILEELEMAKSSLEKVISNTNSGLLFDLDGYVVTGHSEKDGDEFKFLSDKNRFASVVHGNLYFIKSSLEKAIGSIYFSVNYDIDDAPKFANKMIKKTAINNVLSSLPRHMTPKELLETVSQKKFSSLGTARTKRFGQEAIQKNLDKAFEYYRQSNLTAMLALENSTNESNVENSGSYLVNPKILEFAYDEKIAQMKEQARIYDKAMNGDATLITSKATGKQFQINPKALFTFRKDLKDFLPEEKFAEEDRRSSFQLQGDKVMKKRLPKGQANKNLGRNTKTTMWNYKYGMPVSWKDPSFGGLLPEATNDNLLELLRSVKLTPATRTYASFLPVP